MSSSQVSSGGSSQALLASRKRKDRSGPWAHQAQQSHVTTKPEPIKPVPTTPQVPVKQVSSHQRPVKPASAGGNWLLAGYLAHEFLTKGTLLGKQPEGRRAETSERLPEKSPTVYDDVAYLLKSDGAYIAGVVNPSQLALWLQM